LTNKGYKWAIILVLLVFILDFYYQIVQSDKPFWTTEWFFWRIVLIVVVILSISGYFLFTYQAKIKKNKQEYIKRLIDLQEKNWKEVSFELHDNIGQNLLVINNEVRKIEKNLSESDSNKAELEKVSSLVTESIEDIRKMSSRIFPHQIKKIGLRKAIESMVNKVLGEYEINSGIDICEIDRMLDSETELNLFRIIQEAINNIVKHSKAKNVNITIARTGTNFITEIKDDGNGFDYEKILKSQDRGFGLFNMLERAKLIDGKFLINSKPGQGTQIKIFIPVNFKSLK